MVVERSPSAPDGMLPIFRDSVDTYAADACLPLVQAIEARELQMAALAKGHYPGRKLAADALPGLATVGHWDARTEQRWSLSWHRNEGVEISYLERGTIDFAAGGREFVLTPGDIAITRPWQLHRMGRPNSGPNRLHWLILDVGVRSRNQGWSWPPWFVLSPEESDQFERNLSQTSLPVWRATAEVRNCFRLIAQTVKNEDRASNSRLAIRINDLFLSLLDLFRQSPIEPSQSVMVSRHLVQIFLARLAADPENLALGWTLESMASECGLKVTQFVHHVKELTNMAPMHYLNSQRMQRASTLLRSAKSMRVTDIALDCGFSSSQYFATLFKNYTGLSPTQFRCS